jgi:hypothetical protein
MLDIHLEFRNHFIGTPLQYATEAPYFGASIPTLRKYLYSSPALTWGDGKLIEISLNNTSNLTLQLYSKAEPTYQTHHTHHIPKTSYDKQTHIYTVSYNLPRASADDFNKIFAEYLALAPNLQKRVKGIISPKAIQAFIDNKMYISYLQGLAIEAALLEPQISR